MLLPRDLNKLLVQWKGPFEIVATVGINDYRINMGGKEKTFHANLLKGDCEALPELGGWGSEETDNGLKYGDKLTLDQRKQLKVAALTYSSFFSDRPGTASTKEHCIELTSSTPARQRPYPVPYAMRQTLRYELREMEDLGVIKKSSPPYASPVVVVKKKNGTNRVCIDYRRLNKLTISTLNPGHHRQTFFQGMEKDQYFSKIDLSIDY
ncbi:Zinc finger protein [Plakobranchus ocellatus]|uniref:Zinc finger protein n=1 Tax=Plakobranchus ocellatus TaxID=259542 RepID=A0AAV4D2P8_9GAST|nr:Zinc finger protein [Plakobranchus ocellatus]